MAFRGLGPIGQIHVSVTDVDWAVEFYRDVLGIPFLFRVPGHPMAFFVHRDGSSELRMAFFTDPDGNNLALMAERPIDQVEG